MNIAVVGYTGYIGKHVYSDFAIRGYNLFKIDRKILETEDELIEILQQADVLCVFTGYPIIQRWNRKNQKKIKASREGVNRRLIDVINRNNISLKCFISSSAIGIYDDHVFSNEKSNYYEKGFLTDVIEGLENVVVGEHIERKLLLRFGVVLGPGSGYINNMLLPWKFGVTPVFNDGRTNFGFIHIEDLVRSVEHCILNENLSGVVNIISPEINKEYVFHDTLKHKLKFFIPGILARIIFGKASQLILNVPKAVPEKLIKSGFNFQYVHLKSAILALKD